MEIQSGETTHHVVAVGVFFGLISLNLVGESQKKNQRLLFTIFLGKHWGICSRSLVESLVSTNYISTQKTEYISLLKKW